MSQWVILAIVLAGSVAYLCYRAYRTLTGKNDPCHGCVGCEFKQQMANRHGMKREIDAKKCYKKKNP